VLFGDRGEFGCAVDLARRRVHNPPDAKFASRLQNIERALDVRIYIGVGRVVRERDSDQHRKVQHRVATSHGRANTVRVSNVAGENFNLVANFWRRLIQPTPRIKRVVINERLDRVTSALVRDLRFLPRGGERGMRAVLADYLDVVGTLHG